MVLIVDPYNTISNKCYGLYSDRILNNPSHRQSETKRTTVSLDAREYQRLKSRGEFGETFSEVVRRILDQLDAINGGSEK